MVILRILDVPLDEGEQHISTTWQVSDKPSFADRHLESIDDSKNKSTIIFNEVLDPNIKWYGRARVLTSNGYTIWGNVDVFLPNNDPVIEVSDDLPSRISVPQITTSSKQASHDVSMFTISASGFDVLGNATLSATSWIIEDIYGTVVWSSIYNTVDKSQIDITNLILRSNSVYRLKAIFHSTSNDCSPIGVRTIKTSNNDDIVLLTYLDWVDVDNPLDLQIGKLDNVNNVTWSILSFIDNNAQLHHKSTTSGPMCFKASLPTIGLRSDQLYVLKIETDDRDRGAKFIPFRTKTFTETPNAGLEVPDNIQEDDIILDLNKFPVIQVDKKPYPLTESKISVQELLDLPDIEFFPISVDGNYTLSQNSIIDNFTGKHNNKHDAFMLLPAERQVHAAKDMNMPVMMIDSYKDTIKHDILPLTDATGGLIIKNKEEYNPEDKVNGKEGTLRYVVINENNEMLPVPVGALTTNFIRVEDTVNDEISYVFTMSDGVIGDITKGYEYSMYYPRIFNGAYRIILVDIQNKQKYIIPITIHGDNNNRSSITYMTFGLGKDLEHKEANDLFPRFKSYVDLVLPNGAKSDVYFGIINQELGEMVGDESATVSDVTVFRCESGAENWDEDTIVAKQQEYIAKYGIYKPSQSLGKFTVTSKTDQEHELVLRTKSGTSAVIRLNKSETSEEPDIPQPDTGEEEVEEVWVDHEQVPLTVEQRTALGITKRVQLDKIIEAYKLEQPLPGDDGSVPEATFKETLKPSEWNKIKRDINSLVTEIERSPDLLNNIDFNKVNYYFKENDYTLRYLLTLDTEPEDKHTMIKDGDTAFPEYTDGIYNLLYKKYTNRFELLFNAGFNSVSKYKFNMGVKALQQALKLIKVPLEYGDLRDKVKDVPLADYKTLVSDGDFVNMTRFNLDAVPTDIYQGRMGIMAEFNITNKEAVDIAFSGKLLHKYENSLTSEDTENVYKLYKEDKLVTIGVTDHRHTLRSQEEVDNE